MNLIIENILYISIINHIGKLEYGHYFTFIKINNENRFNFNDSKVSFIGKEITEFNNIYSLVYIKN